MSQECKFEPDALPILCVDCDKPTGEMGTCDDHGVCAECRQLYLDAGISEKEVAGMMIGVVSGEYGYKPQRRVLHFNAGNGPVCHARGGPHPMTQNRNETNCKRCLSKLPEMLAI